MARSIQIDEIENRFMQTVMRENELTEIKQVAKFFGVAASTAALWIHSPSIVLQDRHARKVAKKLKISEIAAKAAMLGIEIAS